MPWVKKRLTFLMLIVVLYGAFFAFQAHKTANQLQVLGTNTNLAVFVEPQSGHTPILSAIDSAQKEINVEVYMLTDKEIINHLIEAKNRGVAVRVLLEQHPFPEGNSNNATYTTLKQADIAVQWTNPSFALTHEKSMIIDNKEVFILSQNLTTSAFSKNREFDIEDTNPEDISEVTNIFIADWNKTSFSQKDPHLLVSPNSSRHGLTTLLLNAKNTLAIEMEVISDKEIIDDLCTDSKIMKVRIIIPTFSQISSNRNEAEELLQCGAQVKTLSTPYIHAKMILADNTAYVGSINFTTESMDDNRELGIILTQPDIFQTLATTFENDWAKAASVSN